MGKRPREPNPELHAEVTKNVGLSRCSTGLEPLVGPADGIDVEDNSVEDPLNYLSFSKSALALIVALWIGVFSCSCSHRGNSNDFTVSETAPENKDTIQEDGNSSGGGSFVDENSTLILHRAANSIAKKLRFSSPAIYANLPEGWSAERLAKIIENVKYQPMQDHPPREGRLLKMDYDENDFSIVALKPFFVAYASYPIKFAKDETLANILKDVELTLLHETAHLMGYREEQAESFAMELINILDNDILSCHAHITGQWPNMWSSEVYPGGTWPLFTAEQKSAATVAWFIHRPTGFSFYINQTSLDRDRKPLTAVQLEAGRAEFLKNSRQMFVGSQYAAKFLQLFAMTKDVEKDAKQISTHRKPEPSDGTDFERYYEFVPTASQADGQQTFTAADPISASEVMSITPDRQNHYSGIMTYRLQPQASPQTFPIECESHATPLQAQP